jgi:hypothetical protein
MQARPTFTYITSGELLTTELRAIRVSHLSAPRAVGGRLGRLIPCDLAKAIRSFGRFDVRHKNIWISATSRVDRQNLSKNPEVIVPQSRHKVMASMPMILESYATRQLARDPTHHQAGVGNCQICEADFERPVHGQASAQFGLINAKVGSRTQSIGSPSFGAGRNMHGNQRGAPRD